ncbi:MAG: dihydrofolate reductase [candidate division CPR2 bacterium GW2011_GWC1_39_9]|uniref:Bifunctional deaminase-reductase domain protein n=1 Tax=candidate division CPR2 bacterium GW2011_GWC2_39_10 TaxID=1618345 RepID=A0A0G0LMP9_UNCC2|nr:MAG: Bifunctional deaminase-reductase domain protein [candidate division CPR2 bacterium GW2011_GWC2_39_10]KKR33431.1 MAG: dihydrofolate reductase [candidate division CPR2 bacterium GW2011_GWC1_39_9]
MKITLAMAISLNGYIASENGDEDFLAHEHWKYFSELVCKYGCFIVGRKTYEAVKKWTDGYGFDDFKDAKKIIISRKNDVAVADGYTVAGSPEEAIDILKESGFNKALVIGGSETNTVFAKSGLIDEVILTIEPVLIGKGIPLFSPDDFTLGLSPIKFEELSENIIRVRYKVVKSYIC